jgi:hypothetical protein
LIKSFKLKTSSRSRPKKRVSLRSGPSKYLAYPRLYSPLSLTSSAKLSSASRSANC